MITAGAARMTTALLVKPARSLFVSSPGQWAALAQGERCGLVWIGRVDVWLGPGARPAVVDGGRNVREDRVKIFAWFGARPGVVDRGRDVWEVRLDVWLGSGAGWGSWIVGGMCWRSGWMSGLVRGPGWASSWPGGCVGGWLYVWLSSGAHVCRDRQCQNQVCGVGRQVIEVQAFGIPDAFLPGPLQCLGCMSW